MPSSRSWSSCCPRPIVVPAIVIIWAVAAIPSTMGMVLFPIVMDGAAGPHGRMELMSRRWSYMGLTTAIVVSIVGQFLDRFPFPLNYAIIFASFTLAGFASYFYSRQFRVPLVEPPPAPERRGSFARPDPQRRRAHPEPADVPPLQRPPAGLRVWHPARAAADPALLGDRCRGTGCLDRHHRDGPIPRAPRRLPVLAPPVASARNPAAPDRGVARVVALPGPLSLTDELLASRSCRPSRRSSPPVST